MDETTVADPGPLVDRAASPPRFDDHQKVTIQ